ncbi:MAG: sensor histidine kinase [Enterococcus sp.]
MKKIHLQLWIYFAGIVFALMMVSILITMFIWTKFRFSQPEPNHPIYSLLLFGCISSVIGTGIAGFVAQRILRPINRLRIQMSEVAKGDFTRHLDEKKAIYEVQQLYQDFNTMVTELNSIETLRNDFVSNVSHEFKTPLATIQGYVQLLQNESLDEEERSRFLQRILASTAQLSQLTENILKINKLENQGAKFEKKTYRLDEQIREVILFLQPKWEKLSIEWNIEMPLSLYNGNEELLYQVWLNVIDNAIKYSHEGGLIKIVLTELNESIDITIIDTGIGMTEETKKHSFDKFYQGDTSRQSAGNGLGLALTKKILTIIDGEITIETIEGQGTAVSIHLTKSENER